MRFENSIVTTFRYSHSLLYHKILLPLVLINIKLLHFLSSADSRYLPSLSFDDPNVKGLRVFPLAAGHFYQDPA